MAFQLLPPGTPLVIERMAFDSWNKDACLVVSEDGTGAQAVPADPHWPFRNLAYVVKPEEIGQPHIHYPVAGDARGRAGYDPDWLLLAMLENDNFKDIRIGEFIGVLDGADPMTAYPDPEGPGFGLPLPFAILAKVHDLDTANKALSLLSRFPTPVCKTARWEGFNLAEYQTALTLGLDVRGGRKDPGRDANGLLALAAWLAGQFELPIKHGETCRAIVASGFGYGRRAFNAGVVGPLHNALRRMSPTHVPGSGSNHHDDAWRIRGLLLEAALPGFMEMPDEPLSISVPRHMPSKNGEYGGTTEPTTLTATPANAAALFGLAARLPALQALGARADGRIGWARGEGDERIGAANGSRLFRCAQWLYAHSSEATRARVAAAQLAQAAPVAGRRRRLT